MNRAIRSVALALGLATIASAPAAAAQTIALQNAFPTRDAKLRADHLEPNQISRSDCEFGDVLHFAPTYTSVSGHTVEVWVARGADDCTNIDLRSSASARCWLVYQATAGGPSIDIAVRDIIAANVPGATPSGPGSGTAADCNSSSGGTVAEEITLYFLLVPSSSSGTVVHHVVYSTAFDLLGPVPPVDVEAGVGEERIIVKWKGLTDTADVSGYRLFCDPPPGSAAAGASPQGAAGLGGGGGIGLGGASAGGAGLGAGGTPVDGGSDAALPAADAGAADGAGGTGGTVSTDSGTAGTTGTTCLTGSLLVPGKVPPESYECGTVNTVSATSGTARGLTDYVRYGVGVAAVDHVGNVGPLSSVACATPQPVDDFFELYSRAGGKGGGGFCSLSARRTAGSLVAVLAVGGLALLRRRRA